MNSLSLRGNMRFAKVAMAGLLAVGLTACGGNKQQATGSVLISSKGSALSFEKNVASVYVQVLGVSTSNWPGVNGNIYNSNPGNVNGQWQLLLDKIPTGDVSFYGVAKDANNNVLFETIDPRPVHTIVANQTINVTLLLQDRNAKPAFSNHAPFIGSLFSNSNAIDKAGTVSLAASAGDADVGDVLSYAWTGDGTFTAPSALSTNWTPPGDGDFVLTFTVTDSKGASAALSMTVNVAAANSRGGVMTVIDMNNWPVVGGISASNTEGVVGRSIALVASASDADGDTLTYAWTSKCGTFDSALAAVNFTPTSTGDCDVKVTIDDGRSGSNSGTVSIKVQDPVVSVGPQFYVKWVSPVDFYGTIQGEAQVIAMLGADTSGWTFKWDDGINDGIFSKRTVDGFNDFSDAWYAPASCGVFKGVRTVPVTVLVTNASGASNSATTNLRIHCE